MAKPKTSSSSQLKKIANSAILLVLAILVAVIAYKQIFLASRITSSLPEESFTKGLETCVRENFTPKVLSSSLQQHNLDMQGVLNNVLKGVSASVIKTRLRNNYVTETKVLKVEDFFGKNASIQIQGTLDIVSTVPVLGEVPSKKNYMLTLSKRDASYHFNALSVKNETESQWQEWACVQSF